MTATTDHAIDRAAPVRTPVILLTGSTRGIGAAIAGALRARGATVIGHGRAADEATIAADLAQPGAAHDLWNFALATAGGRIDAVINNAGLFAANPLDRSDIAWLDGWEETMRINLTASAQLSRLAVLNWLARSSTGRLVHIASRAAHRGDSPDHWHYAASKGAMIALHKTIARAYAHHGILSFAISPGFVATRMATAYLAATDYDALAAQIPLGRVAQPDEIAAIATFCALDAPASMTGAVIDANGASHVR